MSKLRTSDHKLMKEQGRRKRPRIERSFRTCSRCECCIENECQFLVACAIYTSSSRDIVFQKIEGKYPSSVEIDNENKLIFLLSQEDKEANKLLAACIHEWLIIREELYPYQNRNY